MNFSKHAAALALFASAAYAADLKASDLVAARDKCMKVQGVTEGVDDTAKLAAFKECLTKENSAFEGLAEATFKATGDFTEQSAAEILKPVEKAAGEKTDEKAAEKVEGKWYDSINNIYGYIGIPTVLILIGGGIYMAVGRKSAESDL